MDINPDSMQKVHDVNKHSQNTPDLRYSEKSKKWTMDETVQEAMNLDTDERGLIMYVATDEESGGQVVLVEVTDRENADFFTGKGNIFTARRLADMVEDTQFGIEEIEDMENTYALRTWDGQNSLLNDNTPPHEPESLEEDTAQEDYTDDLSEFGETVDEI